MANKPSKYPFVKCSFTDCNCRVSHHRIVNGIPDYKTFCEQHRDQKKSTVDEWKLSIGCQNKDGRYGGVPCTCTITSPGQLQVNHKNGNNLDRSEENIEILCGNCHHLASIQEKHHLNQTYRRIGVSEEALGELFEFA